MSFDSTGSSLLELISAIGLPHSIKERTFTAGVAPHVVPKAGFDLGSIEHLLRRCVIRRFYAGHSTLYAMSRSDIE